MRNESHKAIDDDDNEVEISKQSQSQTVQTTNRAIEYKIKPHWYGPEGEPLTADGEGAFRNALGKRYRLVR